MSFVVLGLASIWAPGLAQAETYHVAPSGSDQAKGSAAAPWQTLQHAANQVRPGDTVVVEPGTYAGFQLAEERSGTAKARIRFVAKPGVLIDRPAERRRDGINIEGASYVDVEGFAITNIERAGIRAVECQHVHIRGNRTYDNGRWGIFTGFCDDLVIEGNIASGSRREHGIYVSNSAKRPTLRGNRIFGNNMAGIHMNGDASMGREGMITGALVEHNLIYGNGKNGAAGINCDGLRDSTLRNNILYDNHANGITLYRIDGKAPSTGNKVVHNTIVMPRDTRWCIRVVDASTDNTFVNNICLSEHAYRGAIDISEDSLRGFVSNHNVLVDRFTTTDGESRLDLAAWRAKTGQDKDSILATADELFVDAKNGDFRLRRGSPAIDKGNKRNRALLPASDYLGHQRVAGAAPDLGAIEHCEGAACKQVSKAAGPALTGNAAAAPAAAPGPAAPAAENPASTGAAATAPAENSAAASGQAPGETSGEISGADDAAQAATPPAASNAAQQDDPGETVAPAHPGRTGSGGCCGQSHGSSPAGAMLLGGLVLLALRRRP